MIVGMLRSNNHFMFPEVSEHDEIQSLACSSLPGHPGMLCSHSLTTDLFPIRVADFLGHLSHLGGRGPGPLPPLILLLPCCSLSGPGWLLADCHPPLAQLLVLKFFTSIALLMLVSLVDITVNNFLTITVRCPGPCGT